MILNRVEKNFISAILFASYSCLAYASDAQTSHLDHDKKYTETFEHGSNQGKWAINDYIKIIETKKKPKAYLTISGLVTHAPELETTDRPSVTNSVFTGNYIEKGVYSLSFETNLLEGLPKTDDRPMSIVLVGDLVGENYTVALYKTGDHVSHSIQNWTQYSFAIPHTRQEAEKAGWKMISWPSERKPIKNLDHFEDVMKNVKKVVFYYGEPTLVYNLASWHLNASNITIKMGKH